MADDLIRRGRAKEREVMIEAAYVIPGPAGVERVRRGHQRGIRQRLLTNSLATNDVGAAHAGRSMASVHTKVFVVDRRTVGIGSFNLDPRSIALNTEIVVLVESPELAAQVLDYMDDGIRPENAYRVILETDPHTGVERLAWVTETNGKAVRYASDPETSGWRRFGVWLIGLLPIEEHL